MLASFLQQKSSIEQTYAQQHAAPATAPLAETEGESSTPRQPTQTSRTDARAAAAGAVLGRMVGDMRPHESSDPALRTLTATREQLRQLSEDDAAQRAGRLDGQNDTSPIAKPQARRDISASPSSSDLLRQAYGYGPSAPVSPSSNPQLVDLFG